MPRYAYDRMTALDHSFLVLEKPNAYMHVASTQVFETGPLRTPDGGVDGGRIQRAIAASLHRIPRYRQKLVRVPLEGRPVWVDDPDFHIDYHVRHTSLPRPGDERQLKRLSARIMQQHLDRSRPLWEIWVVEGLEGDRFALVSKVHHCMIDGISGVDLMKVLLCPSPDEEPPEPPPFIPRPMPSRLELLRDELRRRAGLPLAGLRDLRELVREAREARQEALTRIRAAVDVLGTSLRRPSETPLNRGIGPHRRFDWLTLELSHLKDLRKALGGSLNDVVLAIVAGAVRRFLELRQMDPSSVDFRILAPVSVRAEDEQGSLANRVSAWLVDLPVGESDPRERLARIARATAELERSRHAVGAELLTQAAEWTPSTLLALGARNIARWLPFNMLVTNVPGPQVPMYLLGARLLDVYPHVPLADHLGLGVALLSYDGKLGWGFNADWDLVPDLHAFVEVTREAFEELGRVAAARAGEQAVRAASGPRP